MCSSNLLSLKGWKFVLWLTFFRYFIFCQKCRVLWIPWDTGKFFELNNMNSETRICSRVYCANSFLWPILGTTLPALEMFPWRNLKVVRIFFKVLGTCLNPSLNISLFASTPCSCSWRRVLSFFSQLLYISARRVFCFCGSMLAVSPAPPLTAVKSSWNQTKLRGTANFQMSILSSAFVTLFTNLTFILFACSFVHFVTCESPEVS